mmetsp:Transcript_3054/g.10993  ORF Transcript_3054/g.10993 Transcript_3054/m.10993 type:complete len:234 (+) Transcript_3054:58-759(+)
MFAAPSSSSLARVAGAGRSRAVLSSRPRTASRLVVRAATALPQQYKSLTPVADRVLVKVLAEETSTTSGILIPTSATKKQNAGEVVAVGPGAVEDGKAKEVSVKTGQSVMYAKYAGTEVSMDDQEFVLLKESDIIGIRGSDVGSLAPLQDRVLIEVSDADDTTSGGVILTDSAKEKPSTGKVVAVGPGMNGEKVNASPGSTVLYSKYSGVELESSDGQEYIVVRESDILATLS